MHCSIVVFDLLIRSLPLKIQDIYKINHQYSCKLVNSACSSKYECMPGAELDRGDVCFDNGRCEEGKCKNLCEFHGKVPCLCEADNIVSVHQSLAVLV